MPPRMIQYTDSLDTLWEEAAYTEARLLTDKRTQGQAKRFADLLARLEEVRGAQYAAWRDEVVAQAHVDAADDELDLRVTALGRALTLAAPSRDDARLQRYFGARTAAKIAVMGLEAELGVVRMWPDSLSTEDDEALRDHAAPLAAAVARGEEALRERARAQNARRDFMARDKARLVDALNDLRLEVHVELSRKVVPQKLARDWPDGFFRRGSNARSAPTAKPAPPAPAHPSAPPTS